MEESSRIVVTCEGCRHELPDQKSHMYPGGCLFYTPTPLMSPPAPLSKSKEVCLKELEEEVKQLKSRWEQTIQQDQARKQKEKQEKEVIRDTLSLSLLSLLELLTVLYDVRFRKVMSWIVIQVRYGSRRFPRTFYMRLEVTSIVKEKLSQTNMKYDDSIPFELSSMLHLTTQDYEKTLIQLEDIHRFMH